MTYDSLNLPKYIKLFVETFHNYKLYKCHFKIVQKYLLFCTFHHNLFYFTNICIKLTFTQVEPDFQFLQPAGCPPGIIAKYLEFSKHALQQLKKSKPVFKCLHLEDNNPGDDLNGNLLL